MHKTISQKEKAFADKLFEFENQWVAIVRSKTNEEIVANGKKITDAIREAEAKTSGEIRVHFDTEKVDSAVEKAKKMFAKLKMHETELHNGILFYVNLKEKQFAVWGDEGINKNVPENGYKKNIPRLCEFYSKVARSN